METLQEEPSSGLPAATSPSLDRRLIEKVAPPGVTLGILALLWLEALGLAGLVLLMLHGWLWPFARVETLWFDGPALTLLAVILLLGFASLARTVPWPSKRTRAVALGAVPSISGLLWFVCALLLGPQHVALYSLSRRLTWVYAILAGTGVSLWAAEALPRTWGRGIVTRLEAARRRTIATLVGSLVLIALLLHTLEIWGSMPMATGDEPFYAIGAESLIDDGDLKLRNNQSFEKTRTWYPSPLGRRPLLIHMPGLSVILVPFIRVARAITSLPRYHPSGPATAIMLFCARLPAVLGGAAMAAMTFALAEALTERRLLSILAGFLAGLTYPSGVVSTTIYPESLSAAVMVSASYLILARHRPAGKSLAAAGLLLASLPWLGLKYAPVAGALILGGAWLVEQRLSARARALALLAAPLVLSIAGMCLYSKEVYHSYNPSIVAGPMAARALRHYGREALAHSFQAFFGYFLDQKEGLLWRSPWFLLALAPLPFTFRKYRRPAILLSAAALIHLAHYAYYRQWSLSGPPGRPTSSILWIFAVLLACGLSTREFGGRVAWAAALAVPSFLVTAILYANPNLVLQSHEWSHERNWDTLFLWASEVTRLPYEMLPDFMLFDPDRASLVAWSVLLVLGLAVAARRAAEPAGATRQSAGGRSLLAPVSLGLALLAQSPFLGQSVCVFKRALALGKPIQLGDIALVSLYGMRTYPPERDGFWTRGRLTAELLVVSERKLEGLKVRLSSPVRNEVRVRYFDREQTVVVEPQAEITLPAGPHLRMGSSYCYLVAVRSGEEFVPADLSADTADHRKLGVWIAVEGPPPPEAGT